MKPGLWASIIERDARYLYEQAGTAQTFGTWLARQRVICLVPVLEPGNQRLCAGKQTVDHVKDFARLGRRAPDDAQHLVAMCEAHNVWYPPSRALREAEREYLKMVSSDPASA